jgi:hypothetical protein
VAGSDRRWRRAVTIRERCVMVLAERGGQHTKPGPRPVCSWVWPLSQETKKAHTPLLPPVEK